MHLEQMDDLFGVTELVKQMDAESNSISEKGSQSGKNRHVEEITETK